MKKNWQDEALCKGKDNDIFFPDDATPMTSKRVKLAKEICKVCPVRTECLYIAISTDERFGIWGGFSPRERKAIRREFKKEITFNKLEVLVKHNDNKF